MATTKLKKESYRAISINCYKKECFIPFCGNGIKICRKYELGRCKE